MMYIYIYRDRYIYIYINKLCMYVCIYVHNIYIYIQIIYTCLVLIDLQPQCSVWTMTLRISLVWL